jgi:hypothetical protein
MPDYEFRCITDGCLAKGRVVLRKFGMNDEKSGTCDCCGNPLERKYGNFMTAGNADELEEEAVWK